MTMTRRMLSLSLAALALRGASARAQGADTTLTVYNAQHTSLTQAWASGFTADTGTKVILRNGNDTEIGNLLVQEGAASPADVRPSSASFYGDATHSAQLLVSTCRNLPSWAFRHELHPATARPGSNCHAARHAPWQRQRAQQRSRNRRTRRRV